MGRKVLITPRSFGKSDPTPLTLLEQQGYEIQWNQLGRLYQEEELAEVIGDVDGLIVGLDPVTAKVMERGKRLKVITKYGVGVDNIDLKEAKRRGIQVTYTPGANYQSVADFTMTLLLALSRNVVELDQRVRKHRWEKVIGTEIYGKTIGIVGTGEIGKGVAARAKGFAMKLLAYDLNPDWTFAEKIGMAYVDKETLLKESDVISLHLPLVESTRHFIDRKALGMMKESAYLINTARGGIVDEEALYHALKEQRIRGAALDVFEIEPPNQSKLLELKNILLAPHCGASTIDATHRMGMMAAMGLISVLEGEIPKYQYPY